MLRWWVALGASASLCACIDVADLAEAEGTGGAAGSGAATGGGGTGGAGGSTSFCAAHASAAFCKDFDDGKPLAFGFSGVEVKAPCTLVLDTQASASPPIALRSLIPANTPELDSWAYAERDLTPTATDVKLSFDLLVNVSLIGTTADVAALSVDPGGQWHVANLELHPNGARIELGYPDGTGTTVYDETGLNAYPLEGKWARVQMHMVRKAPASLEVSIDGVPAGKAALPAGYMKSGLRMRVGVSYAPKQTKDLALHYDNVLVELQ